MRDSAAKRVFWMIIFGGLVLVLIYASFIWSLGQTIQFTSILIPDSRAGGIIAGIFVQFCPTAFLYLASSYNRDIPEEQNQRMWWLAAFWFVSLFDGLTNLGARIDDISIKGLYSFGFDNPDLALGAQYFMTGMGVVVDFAVVFAEELLGNFLSVFFDNLAALIKIVGGKPPAWLGMVSGVGRSFSGQGNKGHRQTQPTNNQRDRNQPQQGGRSKSRNKNNRNRGGILDGIRNSGNQNRSRRDVPVNRGERRGNVTIMNGDDL